MAKQNSVIGDNIKRYRKSEGIKRGDLADKLYISDSSLRDYEYGTIPPEDRRKLLAQEMGVAIHQLGYHLDFENDEYILLKKKDITQVLKDRESDLLLDSYSEVLKNWYPILSSSASLDNPLFKFVYNRHVENILLISVDDSIWEQIDAFLYFYDLSYRNDHFVESKANILTLLALFWNGLSCKGIDVHGSIADVHRKIRKRKSKEVSEKEKMFIEKYSDNLQDALNILALSDEYKDFYIYYIALAKMIYLCNSDYFGSDFENSYSEGIKEFDVLINSNNRFATNAKQAAEDLFRFIYSK